MRPVGTPDSTSATCAYLDYMQASGWAVTLRLLTLPPERGLAFRTRVKGAASAAAAETAGLPLKRPRRICSALADRPHAVGGRPPWRRRRGVGHTSRAARQSIDLEVPRGCAFGFIGPNGAGKTTLIRLLLGLAEPTSGKMRLLGRDLPGGRAAALARVGAIIEEPRFSGHLTGRENLQVHAAAQDRSAAGRIEASLERVGLAARADDKVKTYSLGMRQRLGLARCLLTDPELLMLDEPMNGLDPAGMLELRHLIHELVAEGRTVLLSSHQLDEVEKICDMAAIVDNGRISFKVRSTSC